MVAEEAVDLDQSRLAKKRQLSGSPTKFRDGSDSSEGSR